MVTSGGLREAGVGKGIALKGNGCGRKRLPWLTSDGLTHGVVWGQERLAHGETFGDKGGSRLAGLLAMLRAPCPVLLLSAEAMVFDGLDPLQFPREHVSGFLESVHALARNAHAVCLIDERQPGGARDGFDLLRQAHAAGARQPAILLAAGEGNARLSEALAAGFAGYLPRAEAVADGVRLERALRLAVATRERNGFSHTLASHLFVLAGRLDPRGAVIELEGSLLERWRLDPGAYLGRSALTAYGPAAPAVRRALAGESAPVEWSTYLEGELHHLEGCLLPDPVRGGAIFFLQDVTDRRRLESEVLRISDDEQRRLGQDLHDGLGQHLAGLAYLSDMLRHTLAARGAPETASAAQLTTLLHEAIAQTRELARGLCPVDLDAAEFPEAMRRLAANVETLFGIRCEVRQENAGADREELRLPPGGTQTATHLYRIAQEAINNGVRHGRARHVSIHLTRGGPGARELTRLAVRDNGHGYNGSPVATRPSVGHAGLGLRMMRYRAHTIGGTFSIGPAEGGGTLVACTFPLASAPGSDYTPDAAFMAVARDA